MNCLKFFVVFVYLACPSVVHSQRTFLDNPFTIQLLRLVKETAMDIYGPTSNINNPVHDLSQRRQHIQQRIPESVPFPCDITNGRSKTVPTSVHKLRPGDIDIIGAMGDSLVAGFGMVATSLMNILIENRGVMALGGGQYTWREYITIPNILKVYNPNLYGYAINDSYTHQPASRFSVGENAAMSRDLPFMAQNLVNRMKNDPKVDIEKHWKLISLLIGANDGCSDICYVDPPSRALEDHRRDLIETLRILRDNLPRTIVVIIPLPALEETNKLTGRPLLCDIFILAACSCLNGEQFKHRRDELVGILRAWQQIDMEVQMYPEFQTEDFSVVSEPFSLHAEAPVKPDGDYDSRFFSADCFHFSQSMNAAIALAMWRNLFEPMNNKSKFTYRDVKFNCPSEEYPFIVTPTIN